MLLLAGLLLRSQRQQQARTEPSFLRTCGGARVAAVTTKGGPFRPALASSLDRLQPLLGQIAPIRCTRRNRGLAGLLLLDREFPVRLGGHRDERSCQRKRNQRRGKELTHLHLRGWATPSEHARARVMFARGGRT
jgi:hypothetical protein